MASTRTGPRRFRATLEGKESTRVSLTVPFDPDEAWGPKPRHHVAGTIDGHDIRGPLEQAGGRWFLSLGPAWRRDCGFRPGQVVSVILAAEGPQRQALAPDIAAALDAHPAAAEFFDALATWYRKNYLRWIDATKRNPEVRAARIAEMIELLEDRRKARPR